MEISFWNILLFILFVFEHLLDVKYVAASTPVNDFKTAFPLQYIFSYFPKFLLYKEKNMSWALKRKMRKVCLNGNSKEEGETNFQRMNRH